MKLDPEIAAYLDTQRSLPSRAEMTLQQVRARMVESAVRFGGEPLEVPRIESLTLPGDIPARRYESGNGIVVYFHGGRFMSGGLESHDRLCRRLAVRFGPALSPAATTRPDSRSARSTASTSHPVARAMGWDEFPPASIPGSRWPVFCDSRVRRSKTRPPSYTGWLAKDRMQFDPVVDK